MKQTKKILKEVCEAIEEKKGDQLLLLDISNLSSFTDYFLICQAYNQRQSQAISDAIREQLKKSYGLLPRHVEGYREAEWILLDYLDFIVHIFSPEARDFYKLERLWSDGVQVERSALAS